MKKTIVIYYSNKGSNTFLASRIAKSLKANIEALKPRINAHFLLLFGLSIGNRKLKNKLLEYDRVILCGPVWMGKFIAPLRSFVMGNRKDIQELVFVTCCGSSFEVKDERFGHGLVFNKVREIIGDKLSHCEAFPITLVLPEDKREDAKVVMETRLNEVNFKGEILDIYNAFIKRIG